MDLLAQSGIVRAEIVRAGIIANRRDAAMTRGGNRPGIGLTGATKRYDRSKKQGGTQGEENRFGHVLALLSLFVCPQTCFILSEFGRT